MNEHEMEALVGTVTPETIERLVLDLEPQQTEADRGTVPLYAVLEALMADAPAMGGSERWSLEMRLKKAVIAALEQVKGMSFVEGDS